MNLLPLTTLRRPPVRRSVALLAVVALLLAGFAHAAHFHKSDFGRGTETHLQCLLCLHVDRWAAPPTLPEAPAQAFVAIAPIVVLAAGIVVWRIPRRYQARGPPRI